MLYGSNTDIEPHIIDAKNAYLLIEIVNYYLVSLFSRICDIIHMS